MDEETPEFVKAVFDNEMLRELILDFTIHTTMDTICRKTLCSVRHVQKCWKLSVSDLTRKSKEPLYKLKLDGNNSIRESPYVQQRGKILDEFLNFIKPLPETFCLLIKPEFFRLENYKSLFAVLEQANTKLVSLDMRIPVNGGSLPCTFPNVNLPNLQKLNIKLEEHNLDNLENESTIFQHPVNIRLLFQSILNTNKSLKTLRIEHNHYNLPGFQYIILPSTITKLTLECFLSDQEMEMLVKTKLPNLSSFYFAVPNRMLPNELIHRVLNNFRTTLKSLYIQTRKPPLTQILKNSVNFPIMDKLKFLRLASLHIELDSRLFDKLDERFPQLEVLECCFQTEEELRPWIVNSNKLESLTGLSLIILQLRGSRYTCVAPSVDILKGVRQSMPNVCNLTLRVKAMDALDLQNLLKEMVHLKKLKVCVTHLNFVENSDLWDSLLTGIPVDIVAGLRANPNYWSNFDVNMDDKPSIRMLQNLSVFELETVQGADIEHRKPLISSLSFKFALNTMTNLKMLNLMGRFKAPEDIIQEWKDQGRKITYSQGYETSG